MLSNQTIEILTKLNKKELRRFGDFLSSPYFNTREAFMKIFDVIYMSFPQLDTDALDFRIMFKKLYPGKSYQEQTIKNLYSEFGSLLKKFIGYEGIKADKKIIDVFIAEGLSSKNCFEISNKFTRASLNKTDEKLLCNTQDFNYKNKIAINYYNNLIALRLTGTKEHYEVHKMIHEDLIIFFLRDIFYLATDNILLKNIFPADKKYSMIEEIINFLNIKDFLCSLEDSKHEYAAYIKVEYLLFHHIKNNMTEEEYYELKREMLNIIHRVKNIDKLHFISRLVGLILSKLIPIDKKYYSEIFELGKLFCELKIFPDDSLQHLSIGIFRDLFTVAVILKEYEWAEKFVNEYANYLPAELTKTENNFCKGVLNFKRRDYEKSLRYFNKVKMSDIIEKINIRFYYMMNYIELKSYESALSALNSIRQFYNDREEIPEMFSVLVQDSLKYFHEVIRCEEKGIKIDEHIYIEARQGRRYYHKQYILEKMEKSLK